LNLEAEVQQLVGQLTIGKKLSATPLELYLERECIYLYGKSSSKIVYDFNSFASIRDKLNLHRKYPVG
jgi:hypothetical protein